MLVGSEPDLGLAGICFNKIREREDTGNRIEIILFKDTRHLLFDLFEHIGNGDTGFFDILIACCTGKCDRLEIDTPDDGDIIGSKPDDIASS